MKIRRSGFNRVAGVLVALVLVGFLLHQSTSVKIYADHTPIADGRPSQTNQSFKSKNSDSVVLAGFFPPLRDSAVWLERSYYSAYMVAGILFLLAESALIGVLLLERKHRKRAQASIARRFAMERVASELSTTLSECPAERVQGEIEKGLRLILQAEAVDRVCWFAIPDGGTAVEKVCSAHGPGVPDGPSRFEKESVPWIAERLAGGEPVVIGRLQDIPAAADRDRRYLETLRIKSVAMVPTSSGTSAQGLLILVHLDREREWPRALIERLVVLGNLFGNALSRKHAEEDKQTSEELFRALFDQASLGIALEDLDGRILFANPALCAMLGFEESDLQQMSCCEVAGAEDSREDSELFQKLRTGVLDSYRIEKRYARSNGTEMWGSLHVSALREGQRGATRVIAMVEDITDRKAANKLLQQAQLDLQQLTGRLIQAQEEERQRISRELHDDIGQRLSLLVFGIDRLHHDLPFSDAGRGMELSRLRSQGEEIISDVHDLSHELHSTKLQHLGLKAALKELCRTISAKLSTPVDFQVSELPHLDSETQLCLYRVAQEALNNVLKHSGGAHVAVSLTGNDGLANLQIKDNGVGFDPHAPASGLGLASMRERLRIVGGVLSVTSVHDHGTEINAIVPLARAGDAAKAS